MTDFVVHAEDGTPIQVQIRGEGPALVLLHGWTAGPEDWQPAVSRLSRHFRCITWRARPHAEPVDPGIEPMAGDLRSLVEQLGLRRPLVAGHSMGAMVVLEHLRQFGAAHIGGIVLIDQSPRLLTAPDWPLGLWGGFTEADNRRYLQALRTDFPEAVLDLIAHSRITDGGGPGPGIMRIFLEARRQRLEALPPEPWIRAWESFIGKDYRDLLPAVTVPTLLVFGALSRYYGRTVAEYMRRHIPNARLHVYPDAGHAPHVEDPRRFVDDLLAFASTAAGTRA